MSFDQFPQSLVPWSLVIVPAVILLCLLYTSDAADDALPGYAAVCRRNANEH